MAGARFFFVGSICAILAVWLSGCGTAVPVEPVQAEKAVVPAPAPAPQTAQMAAAGESCTGQPYSRRRYARLAKRMYLDPDLNRSMPVQYLTDDAKPTRAEIADLYRLHAEVQACRKVLLDAASKAHPLILTALIESFAENDRVWTQAAAGKLTWGQFNEARERLALQATAKMTEVEGQIDSQVHGRARFEAQQRQRAAAAMEQWTSQQQQLYRRDRMADAARQPRMINCDFSGDAANCTSFGAP